MSGSAQAGPSTRRYTEDIIDLTLSDEDEDSLPPLINNKRIHCKQTSISSQTSSIVIISPPPAKERKPRIGTMQRETRVEKGKQADRMSGQISQVRGGGHLDKGRQVDRAGIREHKLDKGKQVERGRASGVEQVERDITDSSVVFDKAAARPRPSAPIVPAAGTDRYQILSNAPISDRLGTIKDRLKNGRHESSFSRRKAEDTDSTGRPEDEPTAGPSRHTSPLKVPTSSRPAAGPSRIVSSTSKAASRTTNAYLPGVDPGRDGPSRTSLSPTKASRPDLSVAGLSRVASFTRPPPIVNPFQSGRSATASSHRSISPQKVPEPARPSTGSSSSKPTSTPINPFASVIPREAQARSRLAAALDEERAGYARPIAGSSRVAKSNHTTADRARAQMGSRTLTKTVSGSSSDSLGIRNPDPTSGTKPPKPSQKASVPSRPLAGSSHGIRSELETQLKTPFLSTVDRAILQSKLHALPRTVSRSSSNRARVEKSDSSSTSRPFETRQPPVSAQATAAGPIAEPSRVTSQAATSSRPVNVGESSRPPIASSSSHAMAKTASGRSVTSNLVRRPHDGSFEAIPMGKTISNTSNASRTDGRGLVPGPREKQKAATTEERGRTEKPGDGDGRGIKRNRSAAFGSHGKPDRPPGAKIQGRQKSVQSSAEVSRLLSPGKLIDTPQSTINPARPMRRTDSLGSAARATPTPAARVLPPAFKRESLLKRSTSVRDLPSPQAAARSTQVDPPSTPPRQPASPAQLLSSGKKPYPLFSPGYRAPQPDTSPKRRRTVKVEPSPIKDNASTDPSYTSHGRTKGMRGDGELPQENGEDANPSRPKRARPAPGTYTVPSMDDSNWPSRNGSSGSEPQRRARNGTAKIPSTQGIAPSSSLDQISEGASNAGKSTRSVVSTSTLVSAKSDKRDATSASSRKRRGVQQSVPRDNRSMTESTSASDLAAAILGPFKTEPATPKSRGERLSTRTPRTISRLSVTSHLSRTKTPISRRTRPATSTPKTIHDGPDEEEEPIENIPPTPSQSDKVDNDDVLAMFADYAFDAASPEQSMTSVKDGVPHTPKSNAEPTTPRTATKTNIIPGSHRSALADTTDHNTTPSKRSFNLVTSPFAGLSPKRPKPPATLRNLAAEILASAQAADEAAEAKRLEREARREERQRTMAAIMAGPTEVELQDLSTIDFTDVVEESKPETTESLEDSLSSRRSDRIRTASLGVSKPTTSTKSDTTKTRDRHDKKPPKPVPTVADNFFARHRVHARNGVQVGDADRVLQAISRSASPKKPDISAYERDSLTPLSDVSDEEGSERDVRLDLLEDNEDISGLLHVAQGVRDSGRNSARESALPQCDIFWSSQPVKQGVPATTVSSPIALLDLDKHISPVLASMLVPALTSPDCEETSYEEAFAEKDTNKRSTLIANLLLQAEINPSGVFACPEVDAEFETYLFSTWISLGARPELFKEVPRKHVPVNPLLVSLNREEASSLLCQSIDIVVRNRWMEVTFIRFLIPILLLLKVDLGTSLALRRTIDDTLDLLWVEGVWESPGVTPNQSLTTDGAIPIALDLVRQTKSLPGSVQTSVLLAVGQTTFEARMVSRWYAAEILSPGCLEALDQQVEHYTPSVDLIISGAERLITILNGPVPNFDQIDDLVTCLYAVLSDIDTLVQKTSYNPSASTELHPLMDLRALLIKIHHGLRAPGEDDLRLQVSHTKARLAQLAIIVEMQFETAFVRMKRDKARAKLGNGLKEGKDGQAMLAFSREASVSVPAERGL